MSPGHQKVLYGILQVVFSAVFVAMAGEVRHTNLSIVCSFLPLAVLSIVNSSVAIVEDGYSIRTIFWFFNYWFGFLVPLASYLTGRWWYGDMSAEMSGMILYANVCILAFTGLFAAVYAWARRVPVLPRMRIWNPLAYTVTPAWPFFGCAVALAATALFVGIMREAIFLRPSDLIAVSAAEKPLYLMLSYLVRPVVVFVFIYALFRWYRQRESYLLLVAFLGVCLLLTNFPVSLARYYLFGMLFAGLAVVFHRGSIIKWISLALLWGGTFAAYLLHPLRYLGRDYRSAHDLMDAYRRMDVGEYFFSGHYAAYEIFVMGLQLIQDQGLAGGRQLLGTLASWIPRIFWPDKPDHTGRLILENAIYRVADSRYDNISAPVYMEVMIDFGWFGLVFFGIVLGFAAAKFDVLFLEVRREIGDDRRPNDSALPLVYTVMAPLPALSFLFWRGSWMPAVGYLVGTAICGLGFSLLIARRNAPALANLLPPPRPPARLSPGAKRE